MQPAIRPVLGLGGCHGQFTRRPTASLNACCKLSKARASPNMRGSKSNPPGNICFNNVHLLLPFICRDFCYHASHPDAGPGESPKCLLEFFNFDRRIEADASPASDRPSSECRYSWTASFGAIALATPQNIAGVVRFSWSRRLLQMIGTGQRPDHEAFCSYCRRTVCQQLCAGGRPVLVVNDGASLWNPGRTWFGKVGAAGGATSWCGKSGDAGFALRQGQFTARLVSPVDVKPDFAIFPAIMATGAVEHIVGGIMHHRAPQLRRLHPPTALSFSGSGLPLAFGLSTAVCLAAFTTTSGRTVRTVCAIPSGLVRSPQLFIKVIHRDHITEGGQ